MGSVLTAYRPPPSNCFCLQLYLESEVNTMQCALCNEYIDDNEFAFDEAFEIDGEYWHAECYAEYYGEELEQAV